MIESSKKNLSILFEPISSVGDVAVCVSFKVKMSSCCLNKIKGMCDCKCFPSGSEEAVLCYALYLTVQEKLCGNPLATSKSKVGSVDCCVHEGSFSITWNVKGTASSIRKSIGIMLKCLSPGKVYSTYAACVKAVGGKPVRDSFNHVAQTITKSIESDVSCALVGKGKLKKEALDAMLEVLHKKLDPSKVDGAKHEPRDHTACDHSDKTEIKTHGWHSLCVKDYLTSKLHGVPIAVCDKYLLLNIKQSLYDTQRPKLKKNVKDYVAAKYIKVGDSLEAMMSYAAISSSQMCASSIRTLLKANLKAHDVESAISSSL